MTGDDPELMAFRARLNATLHGETMSGADLHTLITSWEVMRRALESAPSTQVAVDAAELPHRLWRRHEMKPALAVVETGVLINDIDETPRMPTVVQDDVEARRTETREVARELVSNWRAHHPNPAASRGGALTRSSVSGVNWRA